MAMNWIFENRQRVGVLELRGYMGDSALARFSGAIGWALARCAGPVVIDLTSLQGCSISGQAALEEAARRAAARTAPPPGKARTAGRLRSLSTPASMPR